MSFGVHNLDPMTSRLTQRTSLKRNTGKLTRDLHREGEKLGGEEEMQTGGKEMKIFQALYCIY